MLQKADDPVKSGRLLIVLGERDKCANSMETLGETGE